MPLWSSAEATLAGAAAGTWSRLERSLPVGLVPGDEYRLAIVLDSTTAPADGAQPARAFDFDNLALLARRFGVPPPPTPPAPPGHPGEPGVAGARGEGGASGDPGTVSAPMLVPTRHFYVRFACPPRFNDGCRARLWGTNSAGAAVTAARRTSLWPGGWRWVRLDPRPGSWPLLRRLASTHRRLPVAARLDSGAATTTVRLHLPLRWVSGGEPE